MSLDPAVRSTLRNAVAALEATHVSIAALATRTDKLWRHELIEGRQRLQQDMQSVAALIETMDLGSAEVRRLQAALRRMRSAVALHQANWPAVTIDCADQAYLASAMNISDANRNFITLLNALLAK